VLDFSGLERGNQLAIQWLQGHGQRYTLRYGAMRIKLKTEQLNTLARRLKFEVMLDGPRDVRGMLELLGKDMPWDETGMSKFSNSPQRPTRLTFGVEQASDGYVCDIHPGLAQHIHTLLSSE